MAYTLNEEIPCRTEACTSGEHRPASACNSVYDIILDAIKEVKGDVADIDALAKEQTLLSKVAELKSALSTIDFTTIEQAIKDVKAVAAKEDTLIQGVGDIIKALESMQVDVDLTPVAKETSLNSAKAEIITAIDNAKPEIDLTEVAKETTLNSAKEEILTAVENIELPEIDTTNIASKDLERFFGVKPIEGYEFMTAEEVCSTLEEIITTMDISLTLEQAKEITNNTLNKG